MPQNGRSRSSSYRIDHSPPAGFGQSGNGRSQIKHRATTVASVAMIGDRGSLMGRSGHGRLWKSSHLPQSPASGHPLAQHAGMQYDDHHMKPPTGKTKETTHARIVDAAARAIRRSGYNGTGVAEIMKDAGLTHGGFYAHFPSREAMLAEAADRAGADGVAMMEQVAAKVPPQQAVDAMMRTYLSKEHLKTIETGCATAALCSEMSRQAPAVRRVATRRIKEMIDLVARQSPDWGQPGAHEHALFTVAPMVGALVLARAVDDPKLAEALRKATLKHLSPAQA